MSIRSGKITLSEAREAAREVRTRRSSGSGTGVKTATIERARERYLGHFGGTTKPAAKTTPKPNSRTLAKPTATKKVATKK
jgi:hypothetical protein